MVTQEVLGEELPLALGEVARVLTVSVTFAGDDQHVEALVGFDEGVDQAHGAGGVDVVVHVSVHQEQVAFQVLGQLGVGGHVDLEAGLPLDLLLVLALLIVLLLISLFAFLVQVLLSVFFLLLVVISRRPVLGLVTLLTTLLALLLLLDRDLPESVVSLCPVAPVDVVVVVA